MASRSRSVRVSFSLQIERDNVTTFEQDYETVKKKYPDHWYTTGKPYGCTAGLLVSSAPWTPISTKTDIVAAYAEAAAKIRADEAAEKARSDERAANIAKFQRVLDIVSSGAKTGHGQSFTVDGKPAYVTITW